MPSAPRTTHASKTSALVLALMLAFTTITLVAPTASAIGPNQNDFGTGFDLPDNMSGINSTFVANISGLAPLFFSDFGEFDVNDDQDWVAINLSANEGVALELSFNSTYTSSNGSTYTNDFDIEIYDVNGNSMDSSYMFNPELVSTNNSATPHGGTVYVQMYRYSGYGFFTLDIWTFSTSSGNGTGGGNGTSPPSNCAGSGTLVSDILESNDATSTATQASMLPLSCTGLSIHNSLDSDYFEVDMITGVTYYANITFNGANGDIDTEWTSAAGAYLSSSGSTGNIESMTVLSSTNQTTYLRVYGYSGATNVYDISITTNLPGGGQTFESVEVTMNSTTDSLLEFTGLTVGNSYAYNYSSAQFFISSPDNWSASTNGTLNATATTMMVNATLPTPVVEESEYCSVSVLKDTTGAMLDEDYDCIYIEMLEIDVTSSTTGEIYASNLTMYTDYTIWWLVYDIVEFDNNFTNSMDVDVALSASVVDQVNVTFSTDTVTDKSWQITWNGPTTMNDHGFVAFLSFNNTQVNLTSNTGAIGIHNDEFIPQLPSMLIDSYSTSSTSATNDIMVKGSDLVTGDQYKYQILVTDAAGASHASSALMNFTATAQNMSMPTFTYATPNMSGIYCAVVNLYSDVNVQLIGDSDCFSLTLDDDNDGVANEYDLCANTAAGATVDMNGCELSQKDSDGDGYNDLIDAFPTDSSQYSDLDGDGYGDNATGNSPDAFPLDSSQWDDQDGDGYGDNPNGNSSDAFPYDPTQWSDQDGDGYGDNAAGNYADEYPTDSTQWEDSDGDGYGDNPTGNNGDAFPADSSQWADQDGDGYGDNPTGTSPDGFPNDSTQWEDSDGDGYGDNPTGNNGDAFPTDSTQWFDQDGDGYGDNQAGNDPDAFPMDGTQWQDADGDGYGDNQNGNSADRFPAEPSQWFDDDGDGYGDNPNGDTPDQCLNTPAGQTVDSKGCSAQQKDDDLDGVTNDLDACPTTPAGETVDETGCSGSQEDGDNDGVMDAFDACPMTPLGSAVDAAGCADTQRDTDGDSINDQLDECPSTPPSSLVNGIGCSAAERDTDEDGINDMDDLCPTTAAGEEVDENGCSDAQRDDDNDAIWNSDDACPDTDVGQVTDSTGCAENQIDDDEDLIDNTIDSCPATPQGEQVNNRGCADSQLDTDNDNINNNKDLCPDTDEEHGVDLDGCSEYQKDDDEDGVKNIDDDCPLSPTGSIVFDDGCALTQMDTDQDGINDAEDDFPLDRNETTDTDGDGISDTYDYYPDDPTRSEQASESGGNGGLIIAVVALLIFIAIAALLVVRRNQDATDASPFAEQQYMDSATDSNMQYEEVKELPSIAQESQQWEENGVNWSKAADGSLSYYDAESGAWIAYEQ